MIRIASVNRVLLRRRRLTAVLGVLVVVGVAALNVHAALPEHHHHHGEMTLCVAALSVATAALAGWAVARTWVAVAIRPRSTRLRIRPLMRAFTPWPSNARAGPLVPVVLRR